MISAKEAREYTIDYSKKVKKEHFEHSWARIEKAIEKAIKHKETFVEINGFQKEEGEKLKGWLEAFGYTVESGISIISYPSFYLKVIW